MDGYGTTHTDTVMQTVTIPAGATAATLTLFLHIDSAETSTTTAFDTLTVQVRKFLGHGTLHPGNLLKPEPGCWVSTENIQPAQIQGTDHTDPFHRRGRLHAAKHPSSWTTLT